MCIRSNRCHVEVNFSGGSFKTDVEGVVEDIVSWN